jgi:hypothetical protein
MITLLTCTNNVVKTGNRNSATHLNKLNIPCWVLRLHWRNPIQTTSMPGTFRTMFENTDNRDASRYLLLGICLLIFRRFWVKLTALIAPFRWANVVFVNITWIYAVMSGMITIETDFWAVYKDKIVYWLLPYLALTILDRHVQGISIWLSYSLFTTTTIYSTCTSSLFNIIDVCVCCISWPSLKLCLLHTGSTTNHCIYD